MTDGRGQFLKVCSTDQQFAELIEEEHHSIAKIAELYSASDCTTVPLIEFSDRFFSQ